MRLKALGSALEAGWRALRGGNATGALAQVVSDNFAGMMVIDGAGIIIAASRIAGQLLNQDRPLEGLKARGVLPLEMRKAVDRVLAGEAAQTELALAVLKHGSESDERLVVKRMSSLWVGGMPVALP